MIIYRGLYKDIETDLDNENVQATKRIDIVDSGSNFYNFAYTILGNDYTLTFDPLPVGSAAIVVQYTADGGLTWGSVGPFAPTSPVLFTLPAGTFQLLILVQNAGQGFSYSFVDQIVPLEMTDDPARVTVIDNDEDKFTPIRAKQLNVSIYSSDTISINTFSQGGDTRFKVNYYVNDVLHFTGFLSAGDLSQEFMPDPNIINLIAVDGLGFLNDIPLTDFDGNNPTNENTILDYLLWALKGTGLQLNVRAMFNIREVTAQDLNNDATGASHLFKWCYLDAKTFEEEPGLSHNSYDVITKILGEEGFLFQYLGEWRIMRVDEIEHGLSVGTWFQWNYQGNFLGKYDETHEASIGEGEAHSWMNDDQTMFIEGLVKESRLVYKYELPEEIPCNKDFERGAELTDVPPDKTYTLDCWTLKEGVPGFAGTVDGTTAFIRRVFNANDYEIERYVVVTPRTTFETSSINDATYLESEDIPVSQGDKFEASISFNVALLAGTYRLFRFVLHGEDGSWWILGEDTIGDGIWKWFDTAAWTINSAKGSTTFAAADPDSAWQSINISNIQPIPVSGKLYIWLNQLNQINIPQDNIDVWYSSLSFTYIPFINGSYRKYTGQKHTVNQEVNNRNVRDKQVFISDSPRKLFKGALLISDSGAFPLAGLFYNAATEPDGPVFPKPYGEIQTFDVWNQVNRTMVKFEGAVDHSNPEPDLINKWFLTDGHGNTDGRIFLLLHYELDTHYCSTQMFLIEVSNENINKVYLGHSFKYLTTNE